VSHAPTPAERRCDTRQLCFECGEVYLPPEDRTYLCEECMAAYVRMHSIEDAAGEAQRKGVGL
jgi:uncharacterized OB-fold protein